MRHILRTRRERQTGFLSSNTESPARGIASPRRQTQPRARFESFSHSPATRWTTYLKVLVMCHWASQAAIRAAICLHRVDRKIKRSKVVGREGWKDCESSGAGCKTFSPHLKCASIPEPYLP